jgi:hypothetical protein
MNGVPKTDASALATIDYHFMQTFSMPHQRCYPLPLCQDFGQMVALATPIEPWRAKTL